MAKVSYGHVSKTRQEKRVKAAQALLGGSFEAPATGILPANAVDVDSESDEIIEPRSHNNTSEASSHFYRPRWRRLLKAASRVVSERVDESVVDSKIDPAETARLHDAFTCADAVGGGSKDDIGQLLTKFLDVLGVSDQEIGFVLLCTYQSLLSPDLPFSSATWRPLLVTAVAVAVDKVVESAERQSQAKQRLQKEVAHWWTPQRTASAYQVFIGRDAYKNLDTSRAALARLYFDLREKALRVSPENSCEASVEHMAPTAYTMNAAAAWGRFNAGKLANDIRNEDWSASIFQVSETTCSASHSQEAGPVVVGVAVGLAKKPRDLVSL